jgi:predicted transcriptional regulator
MSEICPRDLAADEALLDAFIKRNKDALNASIEKARAQIMRGEYFTRDQVMADVKAQRQRRRTGKK